MQRRDFLALTKTWAVAAALPLPAGMAFASDDEDRPAPGRSDSNLDALAPAIAPRLDLLNAHTNERFTGRFFSGTGYSRRTLRKANWFMRDWREKEAAQIDPRLYWALAALRQAAMKNGHDGQIVFLSGFRTRKTNDMLRRTGYGAAANSYHIRARAVDFVVPGVPVAQVATYARWLQVGGVGHYPDNFIHIDSGRERSWIG